MKSYRIHLIRHGITQGNLDGLYIGATDMPLCDYGRRQLEELKEKFDYPYAEVFFTSPLRRCKETLGILYPGVHMLEAADLRECSFGEWEGKDAKLLAKEYPDFSQWMASGGISAPPGGESGVAFQARVCKAFASIVDGLLKSGTTDAAVVAHGGTIMAILAAFGVPQASFYDWMTGNGRGYSLRVNARMWMTDQKLEVYAKIPAGDLDESYDRDQKFVFDLAREAADLSMGKRQS